jgi:hypothetical protein
MQTMPNFMPKHQMMTDNFIHPKVHLKKGVVPLYGSRGNKFQ